jgi:single-strand DNA-binding protein
MNNVVLQGNLAADPVSKQVNNTTVVNFTIAASENYKKQDGSFAEDTQFIDCEAWDSGAQSIANNWYKGDPVLVQGKLKKEVWEQDGAKRSRVKVRVTNFRKFARFQKSEVAPEGQVEGENAGVGAPDDEIPF